MSSGESVPCMEAGPNDLEFRQTSQAKGATLHKTAQFSDTSLQLQVHGVPRPPSLLTQLATKSVPQTHLGSVICYNMQLRKGLYLQCQIYYSKRIQIGTKGRVRSGTVPDLKRSYPCGVGTCHSSFHQCVTVFRILPTSEVPPSFGVRIPVVVRSCGHHQ